MLSNRSIKIHEEVAKQIDRISIFKCDSPQEKVDDTQWRIPSGTGDRKIYISCWEMRI